MAGYRETTYKPDKYKQIAQDLESGMGPKAALLRAGYSMNAAKKGMSKTPKRALLMVDQEKRDELIRLGKSISAADQEALARGTFIRGAVQGNDKGAVMAYRLGQDKRVNMFVPENQQNTLIVVPANFDKAKLDEE
jgi:hypothetical protein